MNIIRTLPPVATSLNRRALLSCLNAAVSGKSRMKRLEDEFKSFFMVRHVFFVSSGKAALFVILKALKTLAPERQKVVVPGYTCFSVPSAIVKAGLDVVPCDIDPLSFDIALKDLENVIDRATLCVIPTHLFGIPADVEGIRRVCGDRGVFVVEDAAQAMGVRHNGRYLGTLGDVGFFSMGRGKSISCGSGGVILTDSDEMARAIAEGFAMLSPPGALEETKELVKYILTSTFINPSVYWLPSSLPFLNLGQTIFYDDFSVKRLSSTKASLLRHWKEELQKANTLREDNALRLAKMLRISVARRHIPYLRLPVLVESEEIRDRIYEASKKSGLGLAKMYPVPVNGIKEIKDRLSRRPLPAALEVSSRLLTIPVHHLLRDEDMEGIGLLFSGVRLCSPAGRGH